MKKILITGGSGFIGSNLINYLSRRNYKIYNIDKLSKVSSPEKFKISIKVLSALMQNEWVSNSSKLAMNAV